MPYPKHFEKGDKNVKIVEKCALKFIIKQEFPNHVIELLRHYHGLMT